MGFYSAIAAMFIGFLAGWQINGYKLNAEIAQLHATWNEAYANQARITMDKEHELTQLNTQVELDNASKEKAINDAHDKNIRLATTIKRLQQSTNSSSSTLSKTNSSCKCANATTTSEFSGESINLLVQMAREADEAAKYANTCHEWAVGITKEFDKLN
jgi:hypothetical protein